MAETQYNASVLVVDDDIAVQESIKLLLAENNYIVNCASDPLEAKSYLNKDKYDLVILDLNYSNDTSGAEGLSFLKELKRSYESTPIILITAWGSISLAVEGIKLGAIDFITKPWQNESLLKAVKTALTLSSRDKENAINVVNLKRSKLDEKYDFSKIIGESTQILSILDMTSRICETDAIVLILGESGTGKELIAEAIHNNSSRRDKPFVKVNLGGLSTTLLESELFGHKKGAFTDAYNDRVGRFELANHGSIFLDEIGDLDLRSQVKLLRVLQDNTYQVLGDSNTRKLDVRVICATNKNLQSMVSRGDFREDLYYRINLITLNMPALRQRKEDISLLVKYFIGRMINTYDIENLEVTNRACLWLENLNFPGNIRELKNLVERTWLITGKRSLDVSDFERAIQNESNSFHSIEHYNSAHMTLDQIEKEMIEKLMKVHNKNISKIANSMGISRGTLYRRLEKYGIIYE